MRWDKFKLDKKLDDIKSLNRVIFYKISWDFMWGVELLWDEMSWDCYEIVMSWEEMILLREVVRVVVREVVIEIVRGVVREVVLWDEMSWEEMRLFKMRLNEIRWLKMR